MTLRWLEQTSDDRLCGSGGIRNRKLRVRKSLERAVSETAKEHRAEQFTSAFMERSGADKTFLLSVRHTGGIGKSQKGKHRTLIGAEIECAESPGKRGGEEAVSKVRILMLRPSGLRVLKSTTEQQRWTVNPGLQKTRVKVSRAIIRSGLYRGQPSQGVMLQRKI